MDIKEQISQLAETSLVGTDCFLVEVKVSPAKIIVIIDHPQGVKLEDCVKLNRLLRDSLDDSGLFESHELEVGSPGMEEPLKVIKQYEKRVGQEVGVVTFDGQKHTGILRNVNESGIQLSEQIIVKLGNKKEKQYQENNIPFTQIKETRAIFSFHKII